MLLWISSLKSRCSLAIKTIPNSSFNKATVLAIPIFTTLIQPPLKICTMQRLSSKYAFMSCDILWLTAVLSHHVEATGSFMDDCSLKVKNSYSVNSPHFYNLLTIIWKAPPKAWTSAVLPLSLHNWRQSPTILKRKCKEGKCTLRTKKDLMVGLRQCSEAHRTASKMFWCCRLTALENSTLSNLQLTDYIFTNVKLNA